MEIVLVLLQALYFIFPAYVANMLPVIVKRVPLFDSPISESYLGAHKTYRGFFFGVIGALFVVWIQSVLFEDDCCRALALFDYGDSSVWFFGFLMGFGALAGDAVKSFFKRRKGLNSGEQWFLFDQLDFVVGALVFSGIYFYFIDNSIELSHVLLVIVITPLLHLAVNMLAYSLKLKEVPW